MNKPPSRLANSWDLWDEDETKIKEGPHRQAPCGHCGYGQDVGDRAFYCEGCHQHVCVRNCWWGLVGDHRICDKCNNVAKGD